MQQKIYRVAEGIGHVNGAPVPANRQVRLSDGEAAYDLALGRIFLAVPTQKSASSKAEEQADERA